MVKVVDLGDHYNLQVPLRIVKLQLRLRSRQRRLLLRVLDPLPLHSYQKQYSMTGMRTPNLHGWMKVQRIYTSRI